MKKLLSMLLALAMLLSLAPAALAEAAALPDGEMDTAEAAAELPEGEADVAEPAPELPDEEEAEESEEADVAEPAPALPDREEAEQPEQAAAAALPAIGDIVNGFEAVELRDYPLLDATVVRFEHQKTGAELFYIANDDTNRAFNLAFFTDTVDNTGLPHVFEHATTAGSEKYPSSALWYNLSYQTYNTFINAITSKRFTTYPLASLSEAQLLKLADYYTDSCFNPTLMENEQVYRTEAWRYRMDTPESDMTIEGTVYSEMLGAWTLDRVAYLNALRAMFPGAMAGNDSGGDPDHIPELTWQMLKDYHDMYYHPSNCAAYLYGQFDDYAAFLELLDGYFSAYEKRTFNHADTAYAPITEPVVQSLAFPMEQGSDTEHASDIYYGIVCPGLKADPQQELIMNTLTDLLSDEASNFQQTLQQALPYGSFYAFIELEGPEDAIVFSGSNLNPEDADTFKATVDAALEDVAANGFPQDQVDGVMTSLSISALLIRESSSPVDSVIVPMTSYYSENGDPWGLLNYQDGLFSMDDWNAQGLYAKAVADWLIGSATTALVTTYPEPGAKEAKDAALAQRLAGIKAGMTDEQIAGIVEASNAEPAKDDTSEYVAQLQAVTVESLPEEWKLYDVTDETGEDGVRRINAVAGVDGVGQACVLLDAAGLAQEDIHWFQLYTDLLGELDTAAHTKAELAKLVSRYLYSGGISMTTPMEGDGGCHPYLQLSWIAMDDDLDEGYDLVRELAFDTKLDDPQRLSEQVGAIRASLKSNITANPASTMLRRSAAITSERLRYSTYARDLEYYDFILDTERLLQEDPDAAIAKLQAVQAYFNNRTNAVEMFAGNEASIALNRQLADAFLAALDERPIERVEYDLPVPAQSEALIIDSGVQYNLLMASYGALGLEGFDGGMNAVTGVVDDMFLVPLLRDQYGVYTPQSGAFSDDDLGVFIYAYRDPNIAETFQVLDELPDMVAGIDLDQSTLDGYIMNAYSGYALPVGELSGATNAAMAALQGKPQDQALTWMRQLKALTPEAVKGYADMYAKLSDEGTRRTAGGAAAINANAGLFDVILNPFGAVDSTQVELTDAPEGSDCYEAVRFAFENGLMAPLTEDTFGVDEPATLGDMYAALYAMVGGSRDAGEAVATLAQYGLADANADLEAPMEPAGFWDLVSALMGEQIEPMTQTADPNAATRAELAAMLQAFAGAMG